MKFPLTTYVVVTLSSSLMLSASSVAGQGISSRLQVHIPQSLSKAGGYDHREALFGVPPYGGSIQQNVYYADSNLCDPNVDVHSGYPTRPVDPSSGKMKSWQTPYILMVDRGGCTFVNKVRNAQRSGAAGVIIADNTCLCAAGEACTNDENPDAPCENREPIMADDGSGSDISIPSFLMFKQDADPIKKTLKDQNMPVRMEMSWSLPNPDARVEYELWTTPTDAVSRDFQRQFKEAAMALGQHAYFTPHQYIYDGLKSGCQNEAGENQCYNLCSNNGRYCATDPDNDLDRGISGYDVVKESLRRDCIWKLYGESDGVGAPWWDYVKEFMFRCDNEEYFANEDCAKDCMGKVQIKVAQVEQCMTDSGGLDDDKTNTLLESTLADKDASGVVILPAAYVNNAAIRGALEFATIFKAICAGYAAGSEPAVCKTCANCQDELGCVESGKCPTAEPPGGTVSLPVFAITLGVLIILFVCCGAVQYYRSQQAMRAQVKGILAEYMPVDEKNAMNMDTSVGLDSDDGEFT